MATQTQLPIQPVSKPILCSPYEEPDRHWFYDPATGGATIVEGRRPASYWFQTRRTGATQLDLLAEETRDDLPLVNALREDVRRWRESGYTAATTVTKQLLAHWAREDRPRRLFFCQRAAVETAIYLSEVLRSGRKPAWKPALSVADFELLMQGESPTFLEDAEHAVFPRLIDPPNDPGLDPLVRFVGGKVDFRGCHPCELGLDRYLTRLIDLLVDAIEPDDQRGESPLLPILNRYKPIGSTSGVDFKTTRPVYLTQKSHINAVAADTGNWEQAAAFRLE